MLEFHMVTTAADLKRVLEEAEAALAARPLSARRRQALRAPALASFAVPRGGSAGLGRPGTGMETDR